jgi:hypothetical protein
MATLEPDDFHIGMFVTVLDIKEERYNDIPKDEIDIKNILNMPSYHHNQPTPLLKLLKGTVLRIDAINLPYLIITVFESEIIRNLSQVSTPWFSMPIDIRKVSFTKISDEYVYAYLGEAVIKKLEKPAPDNW